MLFRSRRFLLSFVPPSISSQLSEMAAVIRQAIRLAKHSFRYSSNAPLVVAADLPKVAPYDGIPFAASPEDTTKGELGQVELPSMQEYWTEEMTIVSPCPFEQEGGRTRIAVELLKLKETELLRVGGTGSS